MGSDGKDGATPSIRSEADGLHFIWLAERPDLEAQMSDLEASTYPAFFSGQDNYYEAMDRLRDATRQLRLAVLDENGRVVAGAEAVPLTWDGSDGSLPDGYDSVLQRAVEVHERKVRPDTICAVNLMASEHVRGKRTTVKLMQKLWSANVDFSARAVIGNVRGALKHRYPRLSIEEYMKLTDKEGRMLDPWIRSFLSAGARLGPVSEETLTIAASIGQWAQWTGLEFPASGDYEIPYGTASLRVDLERDEGRYVEPGIWIVFERAAEA